MARRNPSSTDHGAAGSAGGARRRFAVVIGIVIAIAVIGAVVYLHVSGAIGPGLH